MNGNPLAAKMIEPQVKCTYVVELCSGERRRWRYCGLDAHAQSWWCDLETGREFSESSLMYAWQIIREEVEPTEC